MASLIRAICLSIAFLLAATQPQAETPRDPAEARVGAQAHPRFLAQFGGAVSDKRLAAYVDGVGRRLVAMSDQADAPWRFTVLDSPVVNAFATPGGYVYVTRGMLALANDEAELAAVLAHEITHVVEKHSAERQAQSTRGTLGVIGGVVLGGLLGGEDGARVAGQLAQAGAAGLLAQYSQDHEFAADAGGVQLLATAGYDPYAQVRILRAMAAEAELQARIAGRDYNPNRVNFFASHPATGARVRGAEDAAEATGVGPDGGNRARDALLDAIDGMVYGDTPEQGYVRGRDFIHPALRFAFRVPDGFHIVNATTRVRADGPNGARFIFDGGPAPTGSLTGYIRDIWLPQMVRSARLGPLEALEEAQIHGEPAAIARLPVEVDGVPYAAELVVVRQGRFLHRIATLAPANDRATQSALARAARSLRPLGAEEAAALTPLRLRVLDWGPRDSLDALARRLPLPGYARERFGALNGLATRSLGPGARYKTIVQ